MASADDVFHGFCKGCVDEPKNCPLAKNMTVDELQNSLYKALDDLKHNPIPIPNPEFPGGGNLVDYSIVKAFIHRQLYFVSGWPALATMLESVISRDVEGLAESGLAGAATADLLDAESQLGIKCGDVLPSGRADGIKELAPTYLARHRLSRISGDIADQVLFRCAQWKLPAKERYSGNFDVQPKNPVLVVNNRYDPVTPLVSARNVTETIHGSVLLEQNAYGVSLRDGWCTARHWLTRLSIPLQGRSRCAQLRPLGLTLSTGIFLSPGLCVMLTFLCLMRQPGGETSSRP